MRRRDAQRIDYEPCPAARTALALVIAARGGSSQRAAVDMLVIYGAWAWAHRDFLRLPLLAGNNRNRWRTPVEKSGTPEVGSPAKQRKRPEPLDRCDAQT